MLDDGFEFGDGSAIEEATQGGAPPADTGVDDFDLGFDTGVSAPPFQAEQGAPPAQQGRAVQQQGMPYSYGGQGGQGGQGVQQSNPQAQSTTPPQGNTQQRRRRKQPNAEQPQRGARLQNGQYVPQGSMPQQGVGTNGGLPNPNMQVGRQQTPPPQTSATPPVNAGQPKKKGIAGKLVIGVLAVAIVGVCLTFARRFTATSEPEQVSYESTGRYYFDQLQGAVMGYNPETLDALVGSESGDSYLAQEWSYANKIQEREAFIKKVTSLVTFAYPQEQAQSADGELLTNSDGTPMMVEGNMNNGEAMTVTVPDYAKIASGITANAEAISQLKLENGIEDEDYDYQEECFNLLCSYFTALPEIPTTTVEVRMYLQDSVFIDDIELDKALFSSDAYHAMLDEFDKIMTGFTGVRTEKYLEKDEVHNPEFDEWYKLFKQRYDADGGHFDKATSAWEPWYVYDENNKVQVDSDGEKLVRYYSVKDENGNDWIQPPETILQDVEKTREVEDTYEPEKAVPYCLLGAYYAQNEYDGSYSSSVRVGKGTVKEPAGVGTPIITKVLCKDGRYHDIKVTMLGYWVGSDAVDYAVTFSERNRGFDPDSPVKLICYELRVDNLEKKDIVFDSEMMLCDEFASRTGRNGTMYDFTYENITCKAGDSVIFNDWGTSTEIDQKYAAWGKSFNRKIEPVFFKVLAGNGEPVPEYSAYKQFTGNSNISDANSTEVTNNGVVNPDAAASGASDISDTGVSDISDTGVSE